MRKLELKKFTGRPQDWQEFWDSYQSAIHDNEELSDVLKYYLEEPAKKVIAGFSLTAKHYKEAVKLLEQRYVKTTIMKNAHITDLLYAQAVFSEKNVTKLKELYDKIETHYRGVESPWCKGGVLFKHRGLSTHDKNSRCRKVKHGTWNKQPPRMENDGNVEGLS